MKIDDQKKRDDGNFLQKQLSSQSTFQPIYFPANLIQMGLLNLNDLFSKNRLDSAV